MTTEFHAVGSAPAASWSLIIHELLHHLAAHRSLHLTVEPKGPLESVVFDGAVKDPITWFPTHNSTVHQSVGLAGCWKGR
jgi:hypothetical protein